MAPPRKYHSEEERRLARNAASKRWADANREKHRAAVKKCRENPEAKESHRLRQLEYAKKNREKEKNRAAKWRALNPEKEMAMRRNYYISNREAVIDRNRRHRSANKEAYLMYGRLYKAKKRASGEYVHPSYIGLLLLEQAAKCACCDASFSDTEYHIDHVIPLSKGGVHKNSNLQLLCALCNRRKASRPLMDFLIILEGENA